MYLLVGYCLSVFCIVVTRSQLVNINGAEETYIINSHNYAWHWATVKWEETKYNRHWTEGCKHIRSQPQKKQNETRQNMIEESELKKRELRE